ncbi:MAG: RNA-binding protein [Akkermansia sp.]|nr:RNA-binding protein [Akkermansia sp.]
MAEHHTQGRQGQGARRRRNNKGRPYRRRMPRQEQPAPKPSLLQRILSFFGIGKKKDAAKKDNRKNDKRKPKENVRIAKGRSNQGGNPAARQEKQRRRPASVAPTRNARLYVGNLSYEASEAELEDLFKGFGNVRSVEIIYNTRTYKSKGYAFVEMQKLEDAQRAAEVLHGQPFMGRELMVSAASERQENADKPEETPAEAPAEAATEPAAPEAPAED